MTKNEQREFDKAVRILPLDATLAARMVANLHRAGSSRTQMQMEQFIAEHPPVRALMRGTCLTGYYVD